MFPSILIIDDEESILKSLSGILSDEGFETITATNGYEGLKLLEQAAPDLVLLDIWMPGMDGIDTLKEIKLKFPETQVIMITGHGTFETAVNATKIGAFDFIEKPLSIDKVIVAINNALNFRRLEEENRFLRKKALEKNALTGNSPAIAALRKQIAVTAPTDSWVLITGENGVGKELVARQIHQFSARAEHPFIDVNCAALAGDLMDSGLLGNEKGAFTEATVKTKGKLELAHQGTLFLDEVGDLAPRTQATLLRILQERRFQRVGGSRILTVDVRVIASTNKDLPAEIKAGRFREDLYYRLNVVPMRVPPLRERREDIPALARLFLEQTAEKLRKPVKEMTKDALGVLEAANWPGNVRELKNLMERLAILVKADTIQSQDIPVGYNARQQPHTLDESGLFKAKQLKTAMDTFETVFIHRKFIENRRDIGKTAASIGVDVGYLLKKLGMS